MNCVIGLPVNAPHRRLHPLQRKKPFQRERKNTMYQTIILIGNLGKDPEMRFTPGGQPVTTLSVATNRRYNGQNGQPVKETTWFRVTVWGKQAESCNEFLHKGGKVLVEGRLTPDPETGGPHIWENNGKVGASFEVTASTVRFLSGREDQEETEPAVNTQVPPNVDPSEIPF
jgi:single-strand DNA-binding protein